MSFLFPAFLIGALAVAIPIALHLWKRDVTSRVAFSDVRLLTHAPAMHTRRWRLRELLLLALRVAALLLLVVAFARPFVDGDGLRDRPATVVALDRSLSMGAPDVFPRARDAAAEAVANAPTSHAVGLITFDHQGEVVHELSTDRTAVSAAARAIESGAGSTRFAAGVGAAADLIGVRAGQIVVVTDLQESGWEVQPDLAVPPDVDVRVVEVSSDGENLAVTSVDVTPRRVRAVVLNTGGTRSTTISLHLNGRTIASRELTVPSGTLEAFFDETMPREGTLEVNVVDPGGIAADDRRYTLLDAGSMATVGLVTNDGRTGAGAFYLERALLAGENRRFVVTAIPPDTVSTWELSELDAVVVVGTQGLDRQARERLATFSTNGGGLIIVAGPTLDPLLVADVLGANGSVTLEPSREGVDTSFSVTDRRHPVFQAFGEFVGTLGQVRVRQTMRVVETDAARVLARFEDGSPALVEYAANQGRTLVFASDLNNEWNDFPRRPSFVPFVHELTRYVVAEQDERDELLVSEVPAAVAAVPGPMVLPATGRHVVVNVDPRESDVARTTAEEFMTHLISAARSGTATASTDAAAAALESEQGYWWYALFMMAAALLAEVWLGRSMA